MFVVDQYKEMLKSAGPEESFKWLISVQKNPDHVLELLKWAHRFISCGHEVTPGYCLIGPAYGKDKKTSQYVIIKEHAKIGTHSGYLKHKFVSQSKYYGWCPDELLTEDYSIKKFLKFSIWLMTCPSHVMRENCFEFNSLHFHTNASTILDIDSYKGKINEQLLNFIISLIPANVPCVITQAGGRHYYFAPTKNVAGKQKIGIDVLQNGFVFAPPTRVSGGGSYSFSNIVKPADFPSILPEMPPILKLYLDPSQNFKSNTICKYSTPSKTYTGPTTQKQFDVLDRLASKADNTADRSHYDYVAVKWCLQIGLSADEAWGRLQGHGKFVDRGRDYFDKTWENALKR
jgi:hypothetical protein